MILYILYIYYIIYTYIYIFVQSSLLFHSSWCSCSSHPWASCCGKVW